MADEPTLHVLSAGAAQALVRAMLAELEREAGVSAGTRFGAVGAMKEAFDAGEPCDLIVLRQDQIDAMAAAGQLQPGSARALGQVLTGVAVRRGDPHPVVATPEALRAALTGADAVYFPDPLLATAGIHFAKVLRELGVHDDLQPRFRTFPNGATAMRELGQASTPRPIGCTQVTEILYTPGVELAGLLPPAFELGTVYTAAVTQRARRPDLAARLVELISGPASADLRQRSGFVL